MKSLICAVTVLAVSTAQAGVVIHVDDDAPLGGDGLSWATAHRFLQDALAGLADGTEIRVAQGVYKPDQDEANPGGTGNRLLWFDLGFDNNCCFPHTLATCTDEACETLVCAVDPLCCDCCLNDWEQSCADLAALLCGDTCQVFSGIVLIGGYAGLGAPDPDARDPVLYETVLTGDLLDNDVPMPELFDPSLADNSLHVLTANGSDLVIDGFLIQGGASNTNDEQVPMRWGAGLLVIAGTVTVQSCTFTGNVDKAHGGAISLFLGTQAVMTDCTVTGNRAQTGGGISLIESGLTLVNCEISSNVSSNEGAGIYSSQSELVAIDSTFSDNINETDNGGGMHARFTTLTLTNCTFSGNDSTSEGGGLYLRSSTGTATACTFVGNSATFGGGMHNHNSSPTVTNCAFIGNSASFGGGMNNNAGSNLTVTNCTFSGNTATSSGGGMRNFQGGSPMVTNCILWGDSPEEITGSAIVIYSDVQGGWPGTGNIDVDPMFIDPDNGDFRLPAGSPCIDAGHNWAIAGIADTDLDGNPRFADDPATTDTGCGVPVIVDMGAYEFQGDPSTVKFADIDGDGVVGIVDFLALLADWGPCVEQCCLADLDLDGNVGIIDFLLLLANWTP